MAAHVHFVRDLATKRAAFAQLAAEIKTKREEFEATLRIDVAALAVARSEMDAAEAALKSVAVDHFHRTGEKTGVPGVQIKMIKEITVDEEKAFAWAQEKQLAILPARLDLPAIEQMAKVMDLPFVTKREVPRADLSKDLDKALAAVVDVDPPVAPSAGVLASSEVDL